MKTDNQGLGDFSKLYRVGGRRFFVKLPYPDPSHRIEIGRTGLQECMSARDVLSAHDTLPY